MDFYSYLNVKVKIWVVFKMSTPGYKNVHFLPYPVLILIGQRQESDTGELYCVSNAELFSAENALSTAGEKLNAEHCQRSSL